MNIFHKITRATIAIAIFWLLSYGFGSAATDCCNTSVNTCSPSGIRSPLMQAVDEHCHPLSSSRYFNRHRAAAGDVGLPAFQDLNENTTCCPDTPCNTIDFTVYPSPSPPSSNGFLEAAAYCITYVNHNNIKPATNHGDVFNQKTPIYLLTKTIIC